MNKNNLNIACDCDGVLMKTSCAICELVNLITGRNFTFKDIKSWTFWQDIGFDKPFWSCYDWFDRNGRLHIQPYDNYVFDSLSKINLITKKPFDILTANHEAAAPSIYEWMTYWNGYGKDETYSYPNFIVKCLGRVTCKEKLSLPYDIYLDDNPNMAEEIVNYPDKKMILFNCPWNKYIKDTNQVTRVESWKEVPELIKNIIDK